jgi:hypothetical protein
MSQRASDLDRFFGNITYWSENLKGRKFWWTRRRYEFKIDVVEIGSEGVTGFNWFKIGPGGRLL